MDNNHNSKNRYHTKAAKFYKINLSKHTQSVSDKGIYQGRDANRPSTSSTKSTQQQRQHVVDTQDDDMSRSTSSHSCSSISSSDISDIQISSPPKDIVSWNHNQLTTAVVS